MYTIQDEDSNPYGEFNTPYLAEEWLLENGFEIRHPNIKEMIRYRTYVYKDRENDPGVIIRPFEKPGNLDSLLERFRKV